MRANFRVLNPEIVGTCEAMANIARFCTDADNGRVATRRKAETEGNLNERILRRGRNQAGTRAWPHDLNLTLPAATKICRRHRGKIW
jgi:hypothetical protein